jgi:predicted kinase
MKQRKIQHVMLVLRGIPGSGKSTLASKIAAKNLTFTCSADRFFMRQGKYCFDHTQLSAAHARCRYEAMEAAEYCCNSSATVPSFARHVVIIDNTNILPEHYEFYRSVAARYGFRFVTITVKCDVETAWRRCVHNVPLSTIERMAKQLEDNP